MEEQDRDAKNTENGLDAGDITLNAPGINPLSFDNEDPKDIKMTTLTSALSRENGDPGGDEMTTPTNALSRENGDEMTTLTNALSQENEDQGDEMNTLTLTSGLAMENEDSGADRTNALTNGGGRNSTMMYTLTDTVSMPLCVMLGFQHFLMAIVSTAALPLLLIEPLCMKGDNSAVTELIGTNLVAAGIATVLQTAFGVRLPIVQGTSFAYLVPTLSILSQPQWQCPPVVMMSHTNNSVTDYVTSTPGLHLLSDENQTTAIEAGSSAHKELWLSRIREVNGAIMVASLLQVFLGFSGVLNLLLRYVGPLSIGPTVTVIGLSLVQTATAKASQQWGIGILTAALIVVFSQCMDKFSLPLRLCRRHSSQDSQQPSRDGPAYRLPVFTMFPVVLGVLITWLISYILTITDVLHPGHSARTDVKSDVITDTAWLHVPYPGHQGTPTVSAGAVLGILSGVLASVVESVGDYYACAQMASAPPPPPHAINRGIATEGICSILGASMGSANGSTSYSQNIAAIGVTKVACRRVVVMAGVLLLLFGCVGKVGALFLTITEPILGGLFIVLFGMITAVGLSQLGSADLRLGRNQVVIGVSLLMGLCVPYYVKTHPHSVNTGSPGVDQVISVLLSTPMFVSGATGFILDNVLPGTPEERGMTLKAQVKAEEVKAEHDIYGVIPLFHILTKRCSLLSLLPFCPPPPPPHSSVLLATEKNNAELENV